MYPKNSCFHTPLVSVTALIARASTYPTHPRQALGPTSHTQIPLYWMRKYEIAVVPSDCRPERYAGVAFGTLPPASLLFGRLPPASLHCAFVRATADGAPPRPLVRMDIEKMFNRFCASIQREGKPIRGPCRDTKEEAAKDLTALLKQHTTSCPRNVIAVPGLW